MDRRTRTADDAAPATTPSVHAYLVRALACEHPTRPPARYSLANVDEVTLGGGATSAVRTAGRLAITCDDAWASSKHAHLTRSFGRWLLADTGSKNGTFANGERIARHQLADGDVVEIGHTLWRFRELASDTVADATADLAAPFLTLHAPLEQALARAVAAIAANLPILVAGETGVGKEKFVAALHAASGRRGALVAVNCAALPAALVEGELFGHRRGAFSGATDERTGYIRAADHGTLFLDEVGDMPPAAQAALLRVLAERTVTPVGDERPIPVDVAVVSATHRDPDAMVAANTFRADVLARLRGLAVRIPPLRERGEDVGIFIARTLARVAPTATITVDAARALLAAPWPLNVRALEHAVAAAAVRAAGAPINVTHLDELPPPPPAAALPAPLSDEDVALRAKLVAALAAHHGNISAVARDLGRDRKQIHRWIERLAIDVNDPR